jgi:hypothetical protein
MAAQRSVQISPMEKQYEDGTQITRRSDNVRSSGSADAKSADKAIVLVHGGFVDGSGWEGVYKILKADGYDVTIVQNPTTTLKADVVAALKQSRSSSSAIPMAAS